MLGKTIRVYLTNGKPTGILTAEIINWTGSVLVSPRAQLSELAKREEVRRTGIYCLVGPDPDNPLRDIVYIGEGDNVLKRLVKHDKDESKEFWTRCVVVISKDQNITKSHGRYVESRLITMVQRAGRAKLNNGTAPPLPQLPESDVADMEYFIEQLEIVFPVLGFNFLQPKPVLTTEGTVSNDDAHSPLFTLNVVGAEARAKELNGEFVVLKGSTARIEGRSSWTSYKSLREQLVEDKILTLDDAQEFYIFQEDVAFSSPSAGAAIVNAGNMNGRTAWKVEATGQTYQQWYEEKLVDVSSNDETE